MGLSLSTRRALLNLRLSHLLCNGTDTSINCGSDASLDNLPGAGGDFTVDGWFRYDDAAAGWSCILQKRIAGVDGWAVFIDPGDLIYFYVSLVVGNVDAYSIGTTVRDGLWHHAACFYDDVAKSGRIAVDGIWHVADPGAGAYQVDAANNLYFGIDTGGGNPYEGALGWWRLSNSDRFTAGVNFIGRLPSRTEPPLVDANTIEQWNINEGSGIVARAIINTPTNDGTIANGIWAHE